MLKHLVGAPSVSEVIAGEDAKRRPSRRLVEGPRPEASSKDREGTEPQATEGNAKTRRASPKC